MAFKEAIYPMKWFNKHTDLCMNKQGLVKRDSYRVRMTQSKQYIATLLSLGVFFLLSVVITGCGQSLKTLAPIQPVHNIADAEMLKTTDPSANVVVTAIPAEDLAKPVFDKHGLKTVGIKIADADIANTVALTYVLAFDEYDYTLENWYGFLTEWAAVEDQIELPKAEQDSKIVDVLLVSNHPQAFEIQAKQSILTKTLDDITVSICYWRRADLDRKYNRGNSYSPFYENAAAGNQSENTDVFYVKITNNRNEHIILDVKKCSIVDQGESIYEGLYYDDLEDRFVSDRRASGLYVKNGLKTAREILLEKRMPTVEKQVGTNRIGVKPGESNEGFVPFVQVKPNATGLTVIVQIEKAPPPEGAQRYQTIDFTFPFTHNRGIRVAQPAPQRY